MTGALADLRPLREVPAYRRLWLGSTASAFGSQLTRFAVMFYIWERSHDAAMVGLVGLATAVPLVVFAVLGGAVADRVDRRTLVLWTTWLQVAASSALAMLAAAGAGVWPVLCLVSVSAALAAVNLPARRTFVATLLPPRQLAAGLALNVMSFQAAMLLGPVVAGFLTAAWGAAACFAVDAGTFLVALIGLAGLPRSAGDTTGDPRRGLRAVAEGLRLTVRVPALGGAFLSDLFATVLAMPVALFPVINAEKFDGSAPTLGLMMSALAVGGVGASVMSGLVTRRRRAGRVLLVSGAVWGAALAAVAVPDGLVPVLVLIGVAGAADTSAVIARGTVVQAVTPEDYRGRVTALEHVVGAGGPHLGSFRAGLLAAATSGSTAILLGGLGCLAAIGLLAARCRPLRDYTVPDPEVARR
ncbi:MAG TPA: MFS transporter [Nocardioidaceae bacterium]